ncbi:glycerol-3-phosphate 1-O-acyltransferase PlsY [Magnetofaba australis]|uniref:Glycerol-3-phosphate acyltransferase n=1 Tax=Magnetofaba australis IT-1 TaxID=1434232 RepID=A0A1Y2K2H6_9PROT|nr:glycerol-3-phosphate 1-O-acyltransferase PlsY [Magnetofaba australis]OSM00392.1 putative acyl-phosphate glycerol-3-phosphate acyltransferase [Magnetofaba australis IT-1]
MINLQPTEIIYLFSAYLLGAVPFGLVIAKLTGAGDIRQRGSGNIGATNVLRTAGKKAGAATLALDMLKGAAMAGLGVWLFGAESVVTIAGALLVFVGHCYPIYLRFRGGKGVATALGVFLAWTPWVGVITAVIWLASAKLFRISSLAAILAFIPLPLVAHFFGNPAAVVGGAMITPWILWKHRANIIRIIHGEEPRIGQKA